MAAKTASKKNVEKKLSRISFEIFCGVFLAFFAAGLAVTDLMSGKYGGDEIIAHNEKTTALQWFNSKGMKQNLAEGQRDILQNLISSGTISSNQVAGTKKVIKDLDEKIKRYDKEKTEILLGSEKVGKDNWVQTVDGKLGQVIGAQQWENNAKLLGDLGDVYDMATLFLQLCMVIGAVSLVLQSHRTKWVFFSGMMILGWVGTIISIYAYIQAIKIPIIG